MTTENTDKRTIENSSQIFDTEWGSILQVSVLTKIREERRQAVLVSRALIAVVGLEQEVATLSKDDIDKLYEGLEDIPGDPRAPGIIV